MQTSPNTFAFGGVNTQSSYAIFKRIANLILVVIGIVICVNLWILSHHQAANWHDKQANQLGRSLGQLAAKVLATGLESGNITQIDEGLQYIVADKHVVGATVFNASGQMLQQHGSGGSIIAMHQFKQEGTLVFIEQIEVQGNVLGYLRLFLDAPTVMQYHDEYQTQIFEKIQVLLLLALVAGMLVARIFYKIRYRHYRKATSD